MYLPMTIARSKQASVSSVFHPNATAQSTHPTKGDQLPSNLELDYKFLVLHRASVRRRTLFGYQQRTQDKPPSGRLLLPEEQPTSFLFPQRIHLRDG